MKGQIQHAFLFILFILVIGFMAIIGYGAIKDIFSGSCDLDRVTFSDKISNMFERYDDYGSLHKEQIKLPCGATKICFVDSSVYGGGWTAGAPVMADRDLEKIISTAEFEKFNIFIQGELPEPIGYSNKIRVDSAEFVCITSQSGVINLVFKGEGQKTLVEEG